MKALVLEAYNRLEYRDVPDPTPGDRDVLLRIHSCGICGSDVHGMDGSSGRRMPPVIMGHEASGTIVDVGKDVTGWIVGDRVTFDSTVYCGVCWHCRRGEINLCEDRRVLGVSCDEYRQHGAFAELLAVPDHILYRMPEGISFEHAAMVEPLSVALHAMERVRPHLGESVVVVGAGIIGLLVIQAARAGGCGRLIAVDIDDGRLQLARTVGADIGINPGGTDAVAEVRELTEGRGADVVVEAVGIPPTVKDAVEMARKGGAVGLVGNITPAVEIGLQSVVTRELTVYGSCSSRGEYEAALTLMAAGTVDVAPLISGTAPLFEGADWFRRLYEKEAGLVKVILQPGRDE